MKDRGTLALLGVSIVVSLSVGEMFLRALTPFPISTTSNQRRHEELLHVNAGLLDLDPLGFRNRSGPGGKQIFAIGDSHTFGFNVVRDDAWPQRLEEISALPVYNFGAGGYNVYQYYHLFQTALAHGPRDVIVALYPANDVDERACRILRLDHWRRIVSELGLVVSECEPFWRPEPARPAGEVVEADRSVQVRTWLRTRVAWVGAFDYFLWDPFWRAMDPGRANGPVEEGRLRLSEVPAVWVSPIALLQRRSSMDLDRPVVRQHFENSLRLFGLMGEQAEAANVRLSIMIIPSRERVVASWGEGVGLDLPPELVAARASEENLTRGYLDFFEASGLSAIDVGPRMARWFGREAQAGNPTYPEGDGHPDASGYLEYARAAASLLVR